MLPLYSIHPCQCQRQDGPWVCPGLAQLMGLRTHPVVLPVAARPAARQEKILAGTSPAAQKPAQFPFAQPRTSPKEKRSHFASHECWGGGREQQAGSCSRIQKPKTGGWRVQGLKKGPFPLRSDSCPQNLGVLTQTHMSTFPPTNASSCEIGACTQNPSIRDTSAYMLFSPHQCTRL